MRPERDEVDRFKDRKVATKTKAPAKPVAAKKAPARTGGGGSLFSNLVIIVLVAVTASLAWAYVQQEERLEDLKTELQDAIGFISQSKLLIARLEGDLNETGEVLEQSGSAAEKKLEFLDSEMRKLWGVSNDRNKKAIADNKLQAEMLSGKLAEQAKVLKDVQRSQDTFEKAFERLGTSIKSIESNSALVSGEMSIIRETVNEELALMRDEVKVLSGLGQKIKENGSAIASIDSSRKQINARLVDLERRLNELQLAVKPAAPAP